MCRLSVVVALLMGGADALSLAAARAKRFWRQEGQLRQGSGHFHCDPSITHHALWKPAPVESQEHIENLCMRGKQIPDLYILGAAKCATTSLAYELISAGTMCAGGIKEYHYFKKQTLSRFPEDPEGVRDEWLEGMPHCLSGRRALLGDFSPESLSLTDSPGHAANKTMGVEMPMALQSLYGRLAGRVTFVVMLRAPLSRIYSFGQYNIHGSQKGFEMWLQDRIKRFSPQNLMNGHNPVWGSSYGFQMTRWLKVFNHSQFYVIPFKAFSDGNATRICRELVQRLRYQIDCGSGGLPARKNAARHPFRPESAPPELRRQIDRLLKEDKRMLMAHLEQGSQRGMGLALYDGPPGDRISIREWLHSWWGVVNASRVRRPHAVWAPAFTALKQRS